MPSKSDENKKLKAENKKLKKELETASQPEWRPDEKWLAEHEYLGGGMWKRKEAKT